MHFNWDINLTRWLDSRDAFEHPSILIFVESIGNTSFCSSNTIGVGWIAARSNRKKERKKFLCDIPIDIINVISLQPKKMITLLSSSLLFIFSSLFSYPLFFFSFLFCAVIDLRPQRFCWRHSQKHSCSRPSTCSKLAYNGTQCEYILRLH